jgi:hypothetical protein
VQQFFIQTAEGGLSRLEWRKKMTQLLAIHSSISSTKWNLKFLFFAVSNSQRPSLTHGSSQEFKIGRPSTYN